MKQEDEIIEELNKTIEDISPKGKLFDAITYYSNEDLNSFYSNLTQEQAIFCLIEASKAGFRRGAYTMEEIEAISKSLRFIGAI